MTSKIHHQKNKAFEIKYERNELLRQGLAVYISDDSVIKKEILKTHYNDSL